MANRDLDFNQQVTQVTPVEPNSLPVAIAEVGAKVADQAEQSKLLVNGAQAHVAFKQLDAQFRTQYAGDPNNADGLQKLAEDRATITENLGGNISSLYQRQWQNKTTELAASSDVSNEAWATVQNRRNVVSNVNTSIKTYTDMANKDGLAFGQSDMTDGAQALNYLTARQNIEQFGNANIGSEKTQALLKDFNADYVKSFVSGVAETSPMKAAQLLQDPNIISHFTTNERDDMASQIEKVKKSQELQKQLTTTASNSQLPDIVNDPNSTYYEKRAAIDQMDMAGSVTPKAASQARRVIKSSADLDSQTDTPVMADVINKVYDLNANSNTNASDYLRGVQNLQETILEKQGNGQLTAIDAGKLNKQITDLTSKRLSDATQNVGNTFYESNQKFNVLPPEYRGQATRQLFYASDYAKSTTGQDFTKEQYNQKALAIIDNIQQSRRTAALATVHATTQSDPVFLKSINASPSDVTATAKAHGISEGEVIRQLRMHKALQAQKTQPVVLHGGDDGSDAEGSGEGE